jgi:hypothetical protein
MTVMLDLHLVETPPEATNARSFFRARQLRKLVDFGALNRRVDL